MFSSHFIEGNQLKKNNSAQLKYPKKNQNFVKKNHFYFEIANTRKNLRKSWELIRSQLRSKLSHESPSALKNSGQSIQ